MLTGVVGMLLLAACGGGAVGSGGTGATEQGTGTGTVTGFGSVIIDGVRFDDSAAAATIERTADDSRNSGVRAEAKLGHQLAFAFSGATEGSGKLSAFSIEPTLIGRVTALGTTSMTVLGQTVTFNDVSTLGPVTQFEPSRAAATAVSALVEVHATLVDGALVATRVESTTSSGLRVTGVVSNLSSSTLGGTTFTVSGVTVIKPTAANTVVPNPNDLVNGKTVSVFADATGFDGTRLTATRVRVRTAAATGGAQGYLSGIISNFVAGVSFKVNGVTVKLASGAELKPSGLALGDGQYVRIRGQVGSDGSVTASRVQLRSVEDNNAELHGNILGYTAAVGGGALFTVRDVQVTLPASVALNIQNCPAGTVLGDGLYVEVKGETSATGVTATSIKCDDSGASGVDATVERRGTVKSVVADNSETAGSYVITTSSGDLTVKYDSLTFFRSPLSNGKSVNVGAKLEIEGRMVTSTSTGGAVTVLQASKIKLDD
jgi:hypothetical protein